VRGVGSGGVGSGSPVGSGGGVGRKVRGVGSGGVGSGGNGPVGSGGPGGAVGLNVMSTFFNR